MKIDPDSVNRSRANNESITQVREIRVDSVLPGVTKRFDLFGLATGVRAILHVTLAGRDLPVRPELDAVGRVHVDHLDLAPELLLLGHAVHDQQCVTKNHAVGPVGSVLVELNLLVPFEAIEVLEEQKLFLRLASRASSPQVLDECPRVDLLLDV